MCSTDRDVLPNDDAARSRNDSAISRYFFGAIQAKARIASRYRFTVIESDGDFCRGGRPF
jgi:hypothetical protein